MKKCINSAIFVLILLFAMTGLVAANTIAINWTDGINYWPGWSNGTADDSKDTIGIPNITGGQAIIKDGFLESISYNFASWQIAKMNPGDLFLDTNTDGKWDYVLSLGYPKVNGTPNYYIPSGIVNLYDVSGFNMFIDKGVSPSNKYLVTYASDNYGYWQGYGIRNSTPYALDLSQVNNNPLGAGSISGAISSLQTSPFTYTLPTGIVQINGAFTFGFTENCGNDVVLYTDHTIPEPGSLLLIGTGLLGAALLGRKRFSR